ncbi:archaeosortase/exosortase family protein [Methyloversatilis sp.]|uniref:archaeosortase/exosortase family protein n=1 Tax=Methyloversatilis sp. TaxID=2569862 RepID=UPI002733776B|nr:archaeosortase/exosortase family protein [Methyloversatilis sp.]MDP2868365.1 archaeosortase/exosortase family protein [Methyloversatilis sp.]MDP3454198.1 archaeosortase/exosortase family protein [Methyloversatilis sp.]MDP3578364.1 archaeosortase/exosortase family protein [Methyloversatilis sp.]
MAFWRVGLFALIFAALQWGWSVQQDSAVFRLWVEDLNVRAAVVLIAAVQPDSGAAAAGPRVQAPGGGINVLQGCDGAELLWLMTAAFAVAPLAWRWRLAGWLAGLLLAWLLNVTRITALFFAWRSDPRWFDWLHNYIGPIVLVALLALYFQWVMQRAPVAEPEPDIGYR